MSGFQFTRAAARRIAAGVRKIESLRIVTPPKQRWIPGGSEIRLCVFQGDLRPDGDEVAATPYVLALERWPSDPYNEADSSFTTDDEGQEFQVWPWKIPDGYQIPDESEVWVVECGGRWYPLMPEDCLQPVPEE